MSKKNSPSKRNLRLRPFIRRQTKKSSSSNSTTQRSKKNTNSGSNLKSKLLDFARNSNISLNVGNELSSEKVAKNICKTKDLNLSNNRTEYLKSILASLKKNRKFGKYRRKLRNLIEQELNIRESAEGDGTRLSDNTCENIAKKTGYTKFNKGKNDTNTKYEQFKNKKKYDIIKGEKIYLRTDGKSKFRRQKLNFKSNKRFSKKKKNNLFDLDKCIARKIISRNNNNGKSNNNNSKRINTSKPISKPEPEQKEESQKSVLKKENANNENITRENNNLTNNNNDSFHSALNTAGSNSENEGFHKNKNSSKKKNLQKRDQNQRMKYNPIVLKQKKN